MNSADPVTTGALPPRAVLLARSALFWLIFFSSTLLLTFPVMIAAFVQREWCAKLVRFWVIINLRSLQVICKLSYKVEGFDSLPSEPCIVFAKHQSTWETLILKYLMPDILFVAKRELVLIPFFGWALGTLQFVLIDRRSGRRAIKQMIEQYTERKSRGLWLAIFPEGTRRPVGAEPNYKIGGAVVAAETGTGIVPMAVNAGEFWPRHSFIKWPGVITVAFGPVIKPDRKSPEELRDLAQEWIENKMAEITVIDRFPY